jgi:hypothetical protein
VPRTSVLCGLLAAPLLVLTGCQSCVADSSEPQEMSQSHPPPTGSLNRFRPRPMTPTGRFFLRDAGATDE